MKPRQGEKYTEFYILGPGGSMENYSTNLTVREQGRVITIKAMFLKMELNNYFI